MIKETYRDKNGVEITEGCIVKTKGDSRGDYSIVTKYKDRLIIFGHYLSSWVFVANRNNKCPYLTVVDNLN